MAFTTLKRWASSSSLNLWSQPESPTAEIREPCHLPSEIMLEILSYFPLTRPTTQGSLYNVCLLNSEWYDVAIARLYYQPFISGKNFSLFVRTICPSINAHIRKSDLAGLVHVLDMSRLVHHSNKSTTARILGRVKPNLVWFRAPASSFGLNCFAALNKCIKLEKLDLSLVNDAFSLYSLSSTLKKLPNMKKLVMPRSGLRVEDFDPANMTMPPKLEELVLQGGLTDSFMRRLVGAFRHTSERQLELSVIHCPHLTSYGIYDLLTPLASTLRYLCIANIPKIGTSRSDLYLDKVLRICPVEELSISSDYVSWQLVFEAFQEMWQDDFVVNPAFYYKALVKHSTQRQEDKTQEEAFPLRSFELTSSGSPNLDVSLMLRPRGKFPHTPEHSRTHL